MRDWRSSAWAILEAEEGDRLGRVFDVGITGLIVLNIVALVVETVDSVHVAWGSHLQLFETLSVIVFSIEYVTRLVASTSQERYRGVGGGVRFALTPFAIIDLLAILPSLVPIFGLDFRFVRIVRLFRFARIAKLGRYSEVLQVFGRVFARHKAEWVTLAGYMVVMVLFSSCLMYFAEHEAQPEKFSSIPASMWWAVVTLTTVGYGDAVPRTLLGKVVGSFIAIGGVAMVAIPTSVLSGALAQEMRATGGDPRCPHCGESLHGFTEDSAARSDGT